MKRALLMLAMFAACDPPSRVPRWKPAGATEPRLGGTFRFASKEQLSTLDPAIAYDETSYIVLRSLMEPLLDYAQGSTELIPRLAERWEVSPDALTYTFWLRAGMHYEDGAPIVAADVAFAIERVLRTADSPFAQWVIEIDGAPQVVAGAAEHCAGITTPSELQLVIKLTRPNAAFRYVLAMPFTAPQRAAHTAAMKDQLRRRPLASGPYKLAAWSEGERVVLERNPLYTGLQPGLVDTMVMLEAIPRDTQFLMFEQGELDTVDHLAAPDLVWITAQPAWQPYVRTAALLGVFGARFDVTQKPFTDARVRRAFSYALNRDHMTKLLAGSAVPAHGALAPGVLGRDATLQPDPYDPAKARALLAEAGYPDGLAVEYVTIADEEAEKLAVSMQGDFAAAGITLTISVVSFSVYLSAIGKRGAPTFAYAGWIADAPDPTQFLDVNFHSSAISDDASPNNSFYANPALDAVLDAGRAEAMPAKRAAYYRQAERLLVEDPPWLWGYHQTDTQVSQPYVQGSAPHPVWVRDFARVWLDVGDDGRPVRR